MNRLALLALAALLPSLAMARPQHGPPPAPGAMRPAEGDDRDDGRRPPPPMDRASRQKMLRKAQYLSVMELAELMDLDTTGAVKLTERLAKYDEPRIQARLDLGDSLDQLRKIAEGGAQGDAAGLAKKITAARVQIAQLDQKEVDEITAGLTPEKTAKVVLFFAEQTKRLERFVRHGPPGRPRGEDERGAPGMGHHRGPPGAPGAGPQGPGGDFLPDEE